MKVIGTSFNPSNPILYCIQGRHDHNGYQPRLFVLFQDTANRKPIHHRHHDIQKDEIRCFIRNFVQCLLTVGRTDRQVAMIFEFLFQDIHVERLVVDD